MDQEMQEYLIKVAIQTKIENYKEFDKSKEETIQAIQKSYQSTNDAAEAVVEEVWEQNILNSKKNTAASLFELVAPYERKINYYETDQMGIIHHSNYIKYMEETRLEQQGMPYDYVEKRGVLIPVLGVEVRYKKAIQYGDIIEIQQWIETLSPVKYSVIYEIRNKKTGILHATARSKHGFVDKNLKPIHLRKDYPEIYERFVAAAEADKVFLKGRN